MKKYLSGFLAASVAAVAVLSGAANANSQQNSVRLLAVEFEPRQVVQVEVGDFHFKPGQVAPIHAHIAPTVGYVAKGEIIYQVEGQNPRILREGDAFYEPAGPRILRFDNASPTEEAIFLDFNLERASEPFIVFEQQPTQAIDRRTLPTIDLGGKSIDRVEIYSSELRSGETKKLDKLETTLGLVVKGVIELQIDGKGTQRVVAGGSFSLSTARSQATIVGVSSEVPAKVITFHLR